MTDSGHAAVIGGLWGDEGKGKIVDHLIEDADFAVRYQGGANAGHTIIYGDKKIILHTIPSGICHKGKSNIIGNNVIINLDGILQEMDMLKENNIDVNPSNLIISELCHITTPYHIFLDILDEMSENIGTTLKGIGPTYVDKIKRKGISTLELIEFSQTELEQFLFKKSVEIENYAKFKGITPEMVSGWIGEKHSRKKMLQHFLENYFSEETFFDDEKISDNMLKAREKIKNYVGNTSLLLEQANKNGKKIIFEGAQGTLLDICFGSYPYVTSSNTSIGGIYTGTGIGFPIKDIYLVFKAFATRVGGGPFPTEIEKNSEQAELIASDGTEFGATTGRARRIGWQDAVLMKYSARINRATALAITKLDRLDGLDNINICVAYNNNGIELKSITPLAAVLEKCQPVYETVPGWKASTQGITKYEKLPANAKKYIEKIETLAEVPINYIGTGPERKDIIVRK